MASFYSTILAVDHLNRKGCTISTPSFLTLAMILKKYPDPKGYSAMSDTSSTLFLPLVSKTCCHDAMLSLISFCTFGFRSSQQEGLYFSLFTGSMMTVFPPPHVGTISVMTLLLVRIFTIWSSCDVCPGRQSRFPALTSLISPPSSTSLGGAFCIIMTGGNTDEKLSSSFLDENKWQYIFSSFSLVDLEPFLRMQ